jgi:hypothetical protein
MQKFTEGTRRLFNVGAGGSSGSGMLCAGGGVGAAAKTTTKSGCDKNHSRWAFVLVIGPMVAT